jgi:hypothetical protein
MSKRKEEEPSPYAPRGAARKNEKRRSEINETANNVKKA